MLPHKASPLALLGEDTRLLDVCLIEAIHVHRVPSCESFLLLPGFIWLRAEVIRDFAFGVGVSFQLLIDKSQGRLLQMRKLSCNC